MRYTHYIIRRIALMVALLAGIAPYASALLPSPTFYAYIQKHYAEALRQQEKYQVPASITLAQGLVETGAGSSTLANVHNNHFGIKCHADWTGKTTRIHDDAPNECFRSYNRWEDSYRDHSLFLRKHGRYQRLFSLRHDDYRGWAKGLQLAGYATNKGYANALIRVIEEYELYSFDNNNRPSWFGTDYKEGKPISKKPAKAVARTRDYDRPMRPTYLSYGLVYVLADPGDSFAKIAEDMGIPAEKLADYNEVPVDFPLSEGDIVYLETKRSRAQENYPTHTVVVGDSMHSIAQRYGIKIDKLYQYNHLDDDYVPQEGDVLRLR